MLGLETVNNPAVVVHGYSNLTCFNINLRQ
jgi:hypothetical protein